jgi:hypothetical protein
MESDRGGGVTSGDRKSGPTLHAARPKSAITDSEARTVRFKHISIFQHVLGDAASVERTLEIWTQNQVAAL